MQAWLRHEIELYESYIADLRSIGRPGVFLDKQETIHRYTAVVIRNRSLQKDAQEH
jgi:hypothetical protein